MTDLSPAVMPYFPYSRQSKKKSHRGAIVARMLANLMKVAGVDHVVTIDLHATQMQGFFKCPIDNLYAEPLLSKWIRMHIPDWHETVVVSKNPGGTKRVTSLADRMGLSFGIVTTDRRKRTHMSASMYNSVILDTLGTDGADDFEHGKKGDEDIEWASPEGPRASDAPKQRDWAPAVPPRSSSNMGMGRARGNSIRQPGQPGPQLQRASTQQFTRRARGLTNGEPSPLARSHRPDTPEEERKIQKQEQPVPKEAAPEPVPGLRKTRTFPIVETGTHRVDDDGYEEPEGDEDDDDHARDVITGRLIHGHIVDDDVPSPSESQYSAHRGHRSSSEDENVPDHMLASYMSTASSRWQAGHGDDGEGLGGTADATHSDEEEEEALVNPDIETRVTLVGSVHDKPVVIVDDMIDKAGSWIAAAETVVKRGGAKEVYCMATHGLFGGDSLEQLEQCQEVKAIVVTNAFPIPEAKRKMSKKLVVLDVSALLAEAIRRNHHGESISQLYHLMNE